MRPINVCLLSVLCFLAACGSQEAYENKASEAPTATEALLVSADSTSFASDIADINSTSRKVIRTADFRCRVNDVFTAATALENVVKGVGGVVEESRMSNNDSYSNSLYHTADSLKEVHAYTTTSYLTLRVPVASLDSVIKAIPELATFIEHRNISQEDVTLKYLSNSLKNDGLKTTKAMDVAKKSEEVIAADEYLTQKHDNIVDRQVQNLALLDDANYATIKVEFFQPERINTQVVINPEYFAKPSFGQQFILAVTNGWNLLRELFIGLLSIWPLIALGFAGWFAYKRYRRPALLKTRL